MEHLDEILKKIDKSRIKSIKVKWEKTFENRAFPKIVVKLYKSS
jgi:hypothetical protein